MAAAVLAALARPDRRRRPDGQYARDDRHRALPRPWTRSGGAAAERRPCALRRQEPRAQPGGLFEPTLRARAGAAHVAAGRGADRHADAALPPLLPADRVAARRQRERRRGADALGASRARPAHAGLVHGRLRRRRAGAQARRAADRMRARRLSAPRRRPGSRPPTSRSTFRAPSPGFPISPSACSTSSPRAACRLAALRRADRDAALRRACRADRRDHPQAARGGRAGSRSTISAPATPRSRICRNSRSTRSRSTSPSSARSPPIPARRRSPPPCWSSAAASART